MLMSRAVRLVNFKKFNNLYSVKSSIKLMIIQASHLRIMKWSIHPTLENLRIVWSCNKWCMQFRKSGHCRVESLLQLGDILSSYCILVLYKIYRDIKKKSFIFDYFKNNLAKVADAIDYITKVLNDY